MPSPYLITTFILSVHRSTVLRANFQQLLAQMSGISGASARDPVVPVRGKNQFPGLLFKYGLKPIQVALKTGDYNRQVIFIRRGGLSKGFAATKHIYLQTLAISLDKQRWSLAQMLMSSLYRGYDSVYELSISVDNVYIIILNPQTAALIKLASTMIKEGRGSELMMRVADPDAPITVYRYHSLCEYMGDDDMFSSDLSDEQLKMKLVTLHTPCQVLADLHLKVSVLGQVPNKRYNDEGNSMADEYMPEHVDKKILVGRVEEAIEAIMDFVSREGPKGWDDPWN
ncbi:hypothetical protein CDL15_Pgr008514 [Punica granatum]|uniref:Uncharacterized protein n=1 Tax=Punica granatum TaxID=22663 RepID=A0A218WPN9_PUNGR|nr:hypothetical protein CDL15_Pgr008514 [Punica granatum]